MLKSGDTLCQVETEDLFDPTLWDGVKKIGRCAFAFADLSKLEDATLKIPEGVTVIEPCAFSNCEELKKVILPNSIKEIGSEAFSYNRTLEEVVLPNTNFKMGDRVFSRCYNLNKINLPQDMQEISMGAFENSCIEHIDLPSNLQVIGENAFRDCHDLQSINIPANVTDISHSAFEDCWKLKSVNIPNDSGLKTIGNSTFLNCKNLQEVHLPDGFESIGTEAFSLCNSLENIDIPNSVRHIGVVCFRQSGLKSVKLSENMKEIPTQTFAGCKDLKKVENTDQIENIESMAFLSNQFDKITIGQNVKEVGNSAFSLTDNTTDIEILGDSTQFDRNWVDIRKYGVLKNIKINFNNPDYTNILDTSMLLSLIGRSSKHDGNESYLYLAKDKSFVYVSSEPRDDLKDETYELKGCSGAYNTQRNPLFDLNARNNFVDISNLKEQGKVKFIPQNYVLKTFPNSQINKFFENKNHVKWQSLIKTLNLEDLPYEEKFDSLADLLKIYYAIGGFSENTGVRDEAYDYILNHVATVDIDNPTPQDIGREIHSRFSQMHLLGEYNPKFAEFFKKYYKDDKNFLLYGLNNELEENKVNDYLCQAHNMFDRICADYPYYSVNGNNTRGVFTPEFIAQVCSKIRYSNVSQDNIALANMCARYGYKQQTFDYAQKILKTARSIKDKAVISAKPDSDENRVKYRFLEKDDIYGFFIGEKTNCCQRLGDAGEDCVRDGYENPNSGFVVFEEDICDKNDKPTGKKQILGQAYVWYDPNTKTVCYDNIEIPNAIIHILKKSNHKVGEITATEMQSCIARSAKAIMETMNSNGIPVNQVTTGQGFNDAQDMFDDSPRLSRRDKDFPTNKNVDYSDALGTQYIISKYDDITNSCAQNISDNISQANQIIAQCQNFEEQHM